MSAGTSDLAPVPAGEVRAELFTLARRLLGEGSEADAAAAAVLVDPDWDRIELIARTVVECRRRAGARPDAGFGAGSGVGPGARTEPEAELRGAASADGLQAADAPAIPLADAVDAELAAANATLPARSREVLALRDGLRLGYAQVGAVMSLDETAVAMRLSRARLLIRDALRGSAVGAEPACEARDRALVLLARRIDGEPVPFQETDWLLEHLRACTGCERSHATMVEASASYRAWG